MSAKNQVLVIDDEADIRELLGMTLTGMGLAAHSAASTREAFELLAKNSYDLCLTDMRLPDGDGLAVVDHVAKHHPNLPVAVITAFGSTENAVAALKAGAFDYLSKPVSLSQLRSLVRSALKLPRAGSGRRGSEAPDAHPDHPVLIGDSARMQATREMIEKLARSQAEEGWNAMARDGAPLALPRYCVDSAGMANSASTRVSGCGELPMEKLLSAPSCLRRIRGSASACGSPGS